MFISSAYAQSADTTMENINNLAPHAKRVFPPFDFSFFPSHLLWLIICFGLFYLFIARFIVPRLGGIIETRHARIAEDIERATVLKQETDEAIARYEQKLAEARKHSEAVMLEAEAAIKSQTEKQRLHNEALLQKKLADAAAHISAVRDQAMEDVGLIAEHIVAEIIKDMLGISLSKAKLSDAVKSVGNQGL